MGNGKDELNDVRKRELEKGEKKTNMRRKCYQVN